jgi:deoxycytidylate deaminase
MEFDENWALMEAVKVACGSPCQSKRGVIIWSRDSGVMSYGYNALPYPFRCDGSDVCKSQCSKTAVHAEQAALIQLTYADYVEGDEFEMIHVKVVDGKPVHSEKPSCWQCSKLILCSEIAYMWLYQKEGLVKYSAVEFHMLTLRNNDLKILYP